jgi:hypothetical protein
LVGNVIPGRAKREPGISTRKLGISRHNFEIPGSLAEASAPE